MTKIKGFKTSVFSFQFYRIIDQRFVSDNTATLLYAPPASLIEWRFVSVHAIGRWYGTTLQYVPHVTQIARRGTSVDSRHLCCLAHLPISSADISLCPMHLASAVILRYGTSHKYRKSIDVARRTISDTCLITHPAKSHQPSLCVGLCKPLHGSQDYFLAHRPVAFAGALRRLLRPIRSVTMRYSTSRICRKSSDAASA